MKKTKEKELEERSLKLKNMIDFNLVRKVPNLLELRAYLYQILFDDYEFSIDMRERLLYDFPVLGYNMCKWDLNTISEPYIRRILKDQDLLSEEIFYFKKEYNPNAISDNNYTDFPQIFTRVGYVSFDKGGLIVLEVYSYVQYMLFDPNGKNLYECRHSLQFGTDGKLMLRTSKSVFWKVTQYNGESIKDSGFLSPYDSPSYFPDICWRSR